MSKKNKNIEVAVVKNNIEVKAKPGRPINPDSERQKRLRGEVVSEGKRGRPVNPNSARQQRLALMEERRANGEVKRGRPTDPNSKRQQALAAKVAADVKAQA